MEKIGIISAMWIEAEKLHAEMTEVKEYAYNGMTFYDGYLGECAVVLSTCGVGKINAAIYTQLMIDKFSPTVILHTGIAGSLDEAVGHLDFVIADDLTYHDVRTSQMTELFPYQKTFKTDRKLTELLSQSIEKEIKLKCESKYQHKVHRGLIITGDAFVTDEMQKAELKKRFPKALCAEMEGCAIAHTAFVNQVPIGVIRCISDLANGDAAEDYNKFERLAAECAAQIVLDTLENINN